MVPSFDLLLQGCRLPDGRLVDLGTLEGRIAEIGSLTGRPSHRAVDCGGLVLTPGLVDAHIRRLRVKIEDQPDDPKLIVTVRGIGYRLQTG